MSSGWFWPLKLKRKHYFVDGRSVCGKALVEGRFIAETSSNDHDKCKMCQSIFKHIISDATPGEKR